jgi:hypothetical protein
MNQRSKRALERKRAAQDVSSAAFQTGGHVAAHRRGEDAQVRVPQKATGDVSPEKASGLAKASPFFKKLSEVVKPSTKEEERKVIAASTESKPKAEKKEESKPVEPAKEDSDEQE